MGQTLARRPWTASFQKLGRVDRGSVKMTQLVMLIGPNNSGKSYVATLLWTLLDVGTQYLNRMPQETDLLDGLSDELGQLHEIPQTKLQKWLNDSLDKNKNEVMRRALNFGEISVANLKISLSKLNKVFVIREIEDEEDRDRANYSLKYWWTRDNNKITLHYVVGNAESGLRHRLQLLLPRFAEAALYGELPNFGREIPLYLPAARTGLLLSLPFIIGDLLGNLASSGSLPNDQELGRGELSLPTTQFLRQITAVNYSAKSSLSEIADFLEKEVVHGTIQNDGVSKAKFSYQTELGLRVPLHAASSMVSELAPLLLMLRYGDLSRGIVLEEPESHLHLSAQRSMARAIVRIVNAGIPVVLTTHSDTFVQQINILLALSDHPEKTALMKQYGYQDSDLLKRDDVSAYEFIPTRGRTKLKNVALIQEGLAVGSLNDIILEMTEEVISTSHAED